MVPSQVRTPSRGRAVMERWLEPVGVPGAPAEFLARPRCPRAPLRVTMLVERFPSVTETFVVNEIRALRDAGAEVDVIICGDSSQGHGASGSAYGVVARRAPMVSTARALASVARGLWVAPGRSMRTLGVAIAAAGPSARRARRAWRAIALASGIARDLRGRRCDLLHAQFINRPALIAALVSGRTGIPFTVSGHARDVFVPDFRLEPIVRAALRVVVCSSAAHRRLLAQVRPDLARRILLLHHGVAVDECKASRRRCRTARPAGDTIHPIQVLTVARLVPKKGVDTVLRAIAVLERRGWKTRLRLVGDGPLRDRLLGLAGALEVTVEHIPRATPREIHRWMDEADAFAIGCTVADDGDRDGVPNVILEAMAHELPVVTAAGGSVHDAAIHERTALVVEPGDAGALAGALERLATNPALRRRLVRAARAHVQRRFDLCRTGVELATILTEACRTPCIVPE